MAEKITWFIAAWIVAMIFIAGDADIEVLIILTFIGLLIAKEFTDRFTTVQLKHRINIFVGVFFIIFVVAVVKKTLTFVNLS